MTTAPHFMYSLLQTYAGFERTAITQANLLESQTERDFAEMRRLETEKLKKIEEFSESQRSVKNWNLASTIASYFTPVVTTVAALTCLSKEETRPAGWLLGASVVTSIANRILPSMGVYEKISSWLSGSKDMQETIASRLETGMQFTSAVFGAAGGYLACASGAFHETFAKYGTPVMNLGSKGIDFGQSLVQKQSSYISSAIQDTGSRITQLFQRIQETGKESERLSHTVGEICEALKSAVTTIHSRN